MRAPLQLAGDSRDGVGRAWQDQAVRRLGLVSMVACVVALVGMPLTLLMQPNLGIRAGAERPLWLLPLGLAASVAMLLATRTESLSLEQRLDLGLAYLIAICAMTSLFRHALPYAASDVVRGVSPVVVAILFFAVLVPVQPARLGVAASVAVAMDPLALWVTVKAGMPLPPPNVWLWLFMPNVFAVGLAVVISSVLFSLAKSLRAATEMGSYRLIDKLGEGGMGEVWRAEHQSLARPAAVKLVSPSRLGARDPESIALVLQRFEREAQATALLTSPHTIELYDFGVADDGTFFYVMELLEGMDLATMVAREGALPPARVVNLLLQAAHSLRDAHTSGLIHRDVKPANIYVCRKGGEYDFVKVLDFGLVKRFDSADEDAQLTAAGMVAGTPAYMAPEAVRAKNVDPRSDIYSLGCVAYFLLSGRDVFGDVSGIAPVLVAQVERKPKPIDDVALYPVDEALAAIVMRCLAKTQDDRYASVQELMRALEATELASQWTPGDATAWWESQRAGSSPTSQAPSS